MLKSCLPYLGSPDCLDNNNSKDNEDPKSKELFEQAHPNNNNSTYNPHSLIDSTFESTSKQIFVRVVHAGGRVDHYPNAILAGKLLENLPGKWLARPEVFKHPHESILCPEEYLVPGHKYYVVPLSTIHKLKRKHSKIVNKQVLDTTRSKEITSDDDDVSATASTRTRHDHQSSTEEWMEEDDSSFCSARDFYVSRDKWSRSRSRSRLNGGSGSRRGRVLLPLPKPKACSGYTWEPGLTSIQEVSP